MSAKNNVNKDHYTQAGRGRPDDIARDVGGKEELTQAQKRIATGEAALPRGKRAKGRADQPPIVIGADEIRPPVSGGRADKAEQPEADEDTPVD